MDNKNIENKMSISTRWSTLTEILSRCIAPITNLILARLLTPEAFGVVATITMVVSFAEIFADAGFQKYIIQHEFKDDDDLNRNTNVAFWTNFIIAVFLWGIICLFNNELSSLVGNPGLGKVIIVASISIPIISLSSIQMARYKKDFNFKKLFVIRIISSFVPLLITVPLAFIFRSYWALILGTLAGNLISAFMLTLKSSWKPKLFYSFKLLKEMFAYSWWILLESISSWATTYVGTFIVGRFLSNYYLGIYKTAMTTVNQIINLIVAATSGPLFVALSKLQENKQEQLSVYYKFIKSISVLIIPLGMGIFLYRDFVTSLLLGSQWGEASDFIGLWGLTSSFCLILGTYCNGLYNAQGKTYLSFFSQLLHLIVLIPVLIWSANIGFEYLYIARSLIRFEMVLVQLLFMKIFVKIKIFKLLRILIPSIISTLIMSIISISLKFVSGSVFWQILSILVCITVYFISIWLIDKQSVKDCMGLFAIKGKTK